jgi:hypothetical protein
MKSPLGTSRLIALAVIGLLSSVTLPAFAQTASSVLGFESVAELRAFNTAAFGATAPHALTGGYYVAGDGGGNRFVWSGSSTTADNFGTVIKPSAVSSGSPGRWLATATRIFNVSVFGAKGDGLTDDTNSINYAIAAAAGARLYFPAGTYNTNGGHNLNGLNGTQIVGTGIGATIFQLTNATNDLFSTGSTATSNLYLADFTVTSNVTRTAGWVFHVDCVYSGNGYLKKSRFERIQIQKQKNGIWIAMYEFVTLRDIFGYDWVGTDGTGIKIGQTTHADTNQGSGASVENCYMYGTDLAGGPSRLSYGFWIEDCDAVYLRGSESGGVAESGITIKANSGGHAPANHFFNNSIFDATKNGPSARITGGGSVVRVKFTGCWFCSSGTDIGGSATANGLLVDCGLLGQFEITGCNFFNTKGTGLYINPTSCVGGAITGNTIDSCGTGGVALNADGMYLNVPINFFGPAVTGNVIAGGGPALRTSATSNRITVVGNQLIGGTVFGIGCNAANNGN